jgi:hypothetical protein
MSDDLPKAASFVARFQRRHYARWCWVVLAWTACSARSWAAAADEPEPPDAMERLRSMPTERRTQLAKNLAAFDGLNANQKSAIRSIDAKLQELDPEKRERYLSLLRRYHLWLRTLTKTQKKQIDDAPTPEDRIRVVEKLRKEQRENQLLDPDRHNWMQISTLNDLPLFWTAFHLKIWFLLDESDRANLTKIQDHDAQIAQLRTYGQKVKIGLAFKHMKDEIEAETEAIEKEREKQPQQKGSLGKAAAKARRNFVVPKSNPIGRQVIMKYLHDHKPTPVAAQQLSWFVDESPSWLRESLASLPPDDARRRLIVLYRVVFPAGSEIPKPKPKPKAAAPKSAAPAPNSPPKSSDAPGVPL